MRRPGVAVAALSAGLLLAATLAVLARDAFYWDRPLPGVELHEAALAKPVDVLVGGKRYGVRPGEALYVDGVATEAKLRKAGRSSFLRRVRQLADPTPPTLLVEPVLVARPSSMRIAERLSASLPKPQPARVDTFRGSFTVVPSRPGDAVDPGQLVRSLEQAARTRLRTLSPALVHVEPERTTAAAEAAVAEARELVAEPMTLTFKDGVVGTLTTQRLSRLVRFRPDGERFRVTFDGKRIAKAVEPLLADWRARAVNARFVVEGRQVRISPSRPGLAPDGRWIADSITAAASSPIRRASLRLKEIPPDRTTAEAEKLGIREQISTFTTEMGTSSSNRIHNVHLMADYIDGTIVEPGHTFSFNDRVGPRTVERGFLEGQMIVGSLLLPSIGGGVCQTATTLFNNAYELGLPILERHNHSFYISHYPMGRDATVSWGGPDFSFRNDLKTAILIKTTYTDSTLTFSFYGTDPHRKVEISTRDRKSVV